MRQALGRVEEVLDVGAGAAQVEAMPANRIAALARYGVAGKAPLLRGLAEPRKTATLLATARQLEAVAVDDALDLFDSLLATRLIGPARRATDKARLAGMPRPEKGCTTPVAGTARVGEGVHDPGRGDSHCAGATGPRVRAGRSSRPVGRGGTRSRAEGAGRRRGGHRGGAGSRRGLVGGGQSAGHRRPLRHGALVRAAVG